MASEVLRQADAGALDPPLSAHPGSPPAQTSHCNRQSPGRGGSRPSKYHKLSYFRDFSSAAFASLPLQIFHPNSKIRSLCLQDRWPQLADDQEGMFRTLHPPTSLPLSHFCYPSECHQAFFFSYHLQNNKEKNIIENSVMEKASARYTIQNHNSFFSLTVHQLCAIGPYL